MAKNYGIQFVKKQLKYLKELEDKMFEKTGYGFTKDSEEHLAELTWQSKLKKFTREKELGLEPSFHPCDYE